VFDDDAILDQDYVDRFYLSTEQILNQGGLSLVAAHVFPWGMYVMKIIRENLDDSSLQHYGNQAIKRAIKLVDDQSDKKAFGLFTNALEGLLDSPAKDVDPEILVKLHAQLVLMTFHSRINTVINKCKQRVMGKVTAQTGVTQLDFRASLKASEEKKRAKRTKK
jgi:hypothetical protein